MIRILLCFLSGLMGLTAYFYFISFYPSLKETNSNLITIKNNMSISDIQKFSKLVKREKQQNIKQSELQVSPNMLIRIQTMMILYVNYFTDNTKSNFLWKLDRWIWAYFSFLHFSNDDILYLYLYNKIYSDNDKIYEYSKSFFNKSISELTNEEVEIIYKVGR